MSITASTPPQPGVKIRMQVKASPTPVLSQNFGDSSLLSGPCEGSTPVCAPLLDSNQASSVSGLSPMDMGTCGNASLTELQPPTENLNGNLTMDLTADYWKAQYERQVAGQALTKAVTNEIRKSSDLAVIYKTALQGMADLFGVSQGMVLRLRFWDPRQMLRVVDRVPKTRVLVESVWPLLQNEVDQSEAIPSTSQSYWVSECQVSQAAMKRFPEKLELKDLTAFQTCVEEASTIFPLISPDTFPSLLMVPLENKGKPLGFLVLQQNESRQWTDSEVDFVELMAGQISSAIIQTETLRQVESIVEDRTAQLQHSVDLQGKLYELNRKQIERLREMNKRMDEFLSTLSHELRTPLTSMMLAIRMLREASLSPERRSQYLNILEQQCAQETNLVNDLLALQELETKQVAMQVQVVDLNHMTQELQVGFEQRWGSKGLSLGITVEKGLSLSTDVGSLNRVMLELLTNAGKYSDPSTHVTMDFCRAGKQLSIVVSNLGAGIAASELPHIFEKFRRCQGMTDNAVPGTGLGLALVKSLVQHLGGSISAESHLVSPADEAASESSHQTQFTVLLPVNPETTKS
jgi:signal transduction histidine kinase